MIEKESSLESLEALRIRELADKLQQFLEENTTSRSVMTAAMGIVVGEQYATNAGVAGALKEIEYWAHTAYTKGTEIPQ